ncbi:MULTISPECIES: hypothetical protein [unclassified Beijerinckia]|uniref:hypothetical protein n=1 Tax=unclassified Beijerinckia TaxID=2638183 RepID=UPI00089C3014|nr:MULTISPECIES: hypothetical protein [unclassified Beijerinckia]MDH7794209.1 hypothetical protein [Beijerinckia sp. GAS462]SEB55838.1 hypothetical protein SAMN05443249_0474 [Beijerinckia sp. 28-YEA-48]
MTIAGLTAVLPLQRWARASQKATAEADPPLHDCATTYVLRFLGAMTVAIVFLGVAAFFV